MEFHARDFGYDANQANLHSHIAMEVQEAIPGWWFGTFFPSIGNNHPN